MYHHILSDFTRPEQRSTTHPIKNGFGSISGLPWTEKLQDKMGVDQFRDPMRSKKSLRQMGVEGSCGVTFDIV